MVKKIHSKTFLPHFTPPLPMHPSSSQLTFNGSRRHISLPHKEKELPSPQKLLPFRRWSSPNLFWTRETPRCLKCPGGGRKLAAGKSLSWSWCRFLPHHHHHTGAAAKAQCRWFLLRCPGITTTWPNERKHYTWNFGQVVLPRSVGERWRPGWVHWKKWLRLCLLGGLLFQVILF